MFNDQASAENISDEEVIGLILSKDTNFFSVLIKRHQQQLLRLGLSFFHNLEEAKDFVQDVFIKAYSGLRNFEKKSKFSTWLIRIAYNTAINYKKIKHRVINSDFENEVAKDTSIEENHMESEIKKIVRHAIKELPKNQAICVELSFAYNLKYKEISDMTSLPINTIKSHVFRAKKVLREKLSKIRGAFNDL